MADSPTTPRAETPVAAAPASTPAVLESVRCDETLTHLRLSGTLDVAGMGRIETPFTSLVLARRRPTILEIDQLEFLSSLGVSLLLSASRALRQRGVPFVLVGPNPAIAALFASLRLHTVMTIVPSLAEALALTESRPATGESER